MILSILPTGDSGPGFDGFRHFTSSTMSGSDSRMRRRTWASVAPRQSLSADAIFQIDLLGSRAILCCRFGHAVPPDCACTNNSAAWRFQQKVRTCSGGSLAHPVPPQSSTEAWRHGRGGNRREGTEPLEDHRLGNGRGAAARAARCHAIHQRSGLGRDRLHRDGIQSWEASASPWSSWSADRRASPIGSPAASPSSPAFLLISVNLLSERSGPENNPTTCQCSAEQGWPSPLVGSIVARFRASGMALTFAAAGVAQVAIAVGGIAADPRGAFFSSVLGSLWLLAALLFRRSAEGTAQVPTAG